MASKLYDGTLAPVMDESGTWPTREWVVRRGGSFADPIRLDANDRADNNTTPLAFFASRHYPRPPPTSSPLAPSSAVTQAPPCPSTPPHTPPPTLPRYPATPRARGRRPALRADHDNPVIALAVAWHEEYASVVQKTCIKCGDAKALELFGMDMRRKDGYVNTCKLCSSTQKERIAKRKATCPPP